MKKSILLFAIIANLVLFKTILAQAPQAFNYQAMIRNASGDVVSNQSVNVKISILQNSISGITVYAETHSQTTNNVGLISLQVGRGTVVEGDFSLINWGSDLFFIKTECDPTGGTNYQLVGVSQLLSVPYALNAGKVDNSDWNKNGNNINNANTGNVGIGTNTPNSKLEVKGSGDTLFQVKDANGNPVFVVFPDGATVFVSKNAKGNLGGFAVSGRSASKSTYEDVLLVTPDSTRIFVNQNTKGNLGGFAVSGRSASKGVSTFTHLVPDNYFIGHQAGKSVTSGKYNSFIGYECGYSNTTGYKNYFLGYRAGYSNIDGYNSIFLGDSAGFHSINGEANLFIGNQSGFKNIYGALNYYFGFQAGFSNTEGTGNLAIGYQSLYSNTSSGNLAIGTRSLVNNKTGNLNIAIGSQAMNNNITGSGNIAIGINARYSTNSGDNSIAIGILSLKNNTGDNNIGIGVNALSGPGPGTENIGIGNYTLVRNKTGEYNIACGLRSMVYNVLGSENVSYGMEALNFNDNGSYNVAIGTKSLFFNKRGNKNTALGYYAFFGINNVDTAYTNSTAIGAYAPMNASNKIRFGDANVTVIEGQVAYTFPSDGRFKNNVNENVKGLDFINKLRPVTYNFDTKKYDAFLMKNAPDSVKTKKMNETDYSKSSSIIQSGFIAQEVEKAAIETGYIFNGVNKPANDNENYSIAYSLLTVPLVKAVQELDKKNQDLNKQIIEMQNQMLLLMQEIEKLKKK